MTSPLDISPRSDDDLPASVEALHRVHLKDGYPMVWPADPAGWLSPDDTVAAWVARQGADLVGHVLLRRAEDPRVAEQLATLTGLPPERIGSLARLFVAPEARRLGVAAALLRHVATEADARGMRAMLDVVDDYSTGAIALYERQGWLHVGSGTATWTAPDGSHPGLRYYLSPAGS
ncbi:MAG: GNAT family N-acetyltransferase [Actinocatenispora sp.]